MTEIELENHPIDTHTLPQLGDFISFIQSADSDEKNKTRDYIYEEIKQNKAVFEKIKEETGKEKEILELLEDAMENPEILLVIDHINPDLSIALSRIEKAINVKIRKVEVSTFQNPKGKSIILFGDSDSWDEEEIVDVVEPETKGLDEYTLGYHLEGKPEKISQIVNEFIYAVGSLGVINSPMKHYIGFQKQGSMIFSAVVRKKSVVFYSKAKIDEINNSKLVFRDVHKIGHFTNHLPTEIVITEPKQVKDLLDYFHQVYDIY